MPRLQREWASHQGALSIASGADSAVDMLALWKAERGVNQFKGTIGTIIGEMVVTPTTVLGTGSQLRCGLCIVVLPAGATSTPVPGVDSWPYMHLWQPQWQPLMQEVGAGDFDPVSIRYSFHVRSMRKITTNEELVFKTHNFNAANVVMGLTCNILLLT